MKKSIKFLWFLLFIIAILATIGGPGYLFYYGQPLFATCVLIFSLYGWRHLIKLTKEVING